MFRAGALSHITNHTSKGKNMKNSDLLHMSLRGSFGNTSLDVPVVRHPSIGSGNQSQSTEAL